jgi:hypothetical protein
MPPAPRRPGLPAAAAVLGALLLAACGGGSGAVTPGGTTANPLATVTPRPADLSYEFRYEGAVQGGAVLDTSGKDNPGVIRTGSGGTVTGQADEAGTDQQAGAFLRFPAGQCALPTGCPQALVQTTLPVNPGAGGTAPFRFGARVQLQGEPGEAGENVLERGRAIAGQPQWKLQVDHGQATCRWSDGQNVVLLPTDVGASLPLQQHHWYAVECERQAGGLFAITVFDAATGRAEGRFTKTVPAMGAILPEGPVTIGAKRIGGADDQTDQFRGDLDDLWFHTD